MDIIASLTSSSAASTQASASSQSQSTSAESFSLAFNQASDASASEASTRSATPAAAASDVKAQADSSTSTDSNVAQVAPKTTTSSGSSGKATSKAATASDTAEESDLALSVPVEAEPVVEELPAPVVSTPQITQPNLQAAAGEIEEVTPITDEEFDLDLYASADDLVESTDPNATDSTHEGDSTLDDIRQRMDLIQSAGQLDASAMIAVQAVPVQATVPVSTSLSAAGEAGQLSEDTGALSNASLQASAMTADTALEVDPDVVDQAPDQDVARTLTDVASNVTQDLSTQSDSASVDNLTDSTDTSSNFSLTSLTLNSTGVANTDKAASSGLTLSAAIGSTDWQDGLGQQVIDMIKRGEKQVDLRLHPADLGPLSISLNLNDGNTQAQFQSAHASVRAAVEQALPQLRDALASQGITLGQASVSDESSRQAAGQQARQDAPNGDTTSASLADSALEVEEVPVQSLVVSARGVDLYI